MTHEVSSTITPTFKCKSPSLSSNFPNHIVRGRVLTLAISQPGPQVLTADMTAKHMQPAPSPQASSDPSRSREDLRKQTSLSFFPFPEKGPLNKSVFNLSLSWLCAQCFRGHPGDQTEALEMLYSRVKYQPNDHKTS